MTKTTHFIYFLEYLSTLQIKNPKIANIMHAFLT
jgi:hypothetical protein